MADEFQLIENCFKPLSLGLAESETGIGDDGAVLDVPQGKQLVVVTDTLVAGVHFPVDAKPEDIAYKAVAVNLSDLAAMGAIPAFCSLALTLPDNDNEWLTAFSSGLKEVMQQFQVKLIGGDTTKGPLTITVTAQGWVDQSEAVLRSTAKPGDKICVTNTIGDAALGLKIALNTLTDEQQSKLSTEQQDFVLQALHRPQPQVVLADLIKDFAHSAIDISDGLVADLSHIVKQSSKCNQQALKAILRLEDIPLSAALKTYIAQTGDWQPVLFGGDDYQLCFTLATEELAVMQQMSELLGVKITVIGELEPQATSIQQGDMPVVEVLENGKTYVLDASSGYLHFK